MTRKHFRRMAVAMYNSQPTMPYRCENCHSIGPDQLADADGTCPICGYSVVDKPEFKHYLLSMNQWRKTLVAIASACAAFNSGFQTGRFVRACEDGEDRG